MSRIDKINNAIKKEVSQIVQEELKDPRLGFITITRVETTKDLSYAKIYFSVFAENQQLEKVESGLLSSVGFIRRLLGQRLRIRHIPELIFKLDKSAEYTMQILKKIEEIKDEPKEDHPGN